MTIEIDQSGKVENTSKDTIIGYSNSSFKSIIIKAKEKRQVQKVFRQINKPRIFVYRVFAILIFLLVRSELRRIATIIIDKEYPGQSGLIKHYLLQEIKKVKHDFKKENIVFEEIGKKSRAHYVAYGVATGKRTADITVTAKDILQFVVK
jgi:hypothetical protein